jgi:membrane glycosyltransferase
LSSCAGGARPIYNEDPWQVFANLQAVAQSLEETGCAGAFSMFVLSDTTNPEVWLEEERAWAKMAVDLPAEVRVFYRHRPENTCRKAGNIAEFCRRWGGLYKYMIVLDADSVMEGATLVELVRRMETDAELGILQAPPRPVARQSFFARLLQFAADTYGPVFLEGFALWSQCDGNYWGHNAIIRIRPFMDYCDLPILPGAGPLGGEILSHDFVEAALMRRAGYKVCLAHDLDGSYEECPSNLLAYAQRDQRWCQGNLQHLRLLCAEGLHPASRLHLGMGVMAYLASPLWLLFLMLTFLGVLVVGGAGSADGVPGGVLLFAASMALLLLPKLWGVIARRPPSSGSPGKRGRAWLSMLVETLTSMLVAPIMMLLHTQFVAATLLGKKVKWNAQHREDGGLSLGDAVAVHYSHTLFGLAGAVLAWLWAPGLLPWLSPVLLGLVLAIPLSLLLGSVRVGQFLARRQLLLIPEEVAPTGVLQYQQAALARARAARAALLDQTEPFILLLRDPTFYSLHVGILRATDSDRPLPAEQRTRLGDLVRAAAFPQITAPERRAVLSDSSTLEWLHLLMRTHHRRTPSALLT